MVTHIMSKLSICTSLVKKGIPVMSDYASGSFEALLGILPKSFMGIPLYREPNSLASHITSLPPSY